MNELRLSDLRIEAALTPQRAELTFQLRDESLLGDDLDWSGRVRGPFCAERQTLAANYRVRTAKSGNAGLATIPDFCHWSSESQFFYQLELEWRRGGEVIGAARDTLALNWVTVHQAKFYQAGKRWVPRLARLKAPLQDLPSDLEELRGLLAQVRAWNLVLVITQEQASEFLLRECLALGVWVAVETSEGGGGSPAQWESFACVLLVIAKAGGAISDSISLLRAKRAGLAEAMNAEIWSVFRGDAPTGAKLIMREGVHETPKAARQACDRLQADSAGLGEWAGYLG